MLGDINKYFNNDNNTCTNQNLIGNKDSCRGFILKEWVASNQKRINFKLYDKEKFSTCRRRLFSSGSLVLHNGPNIFRTVPRAINKRKQVTRTKYSVA